MYQAYTGGNRLLDTIPKAEAAMLQSSVHVVSVQVREPMTSSGEPFEHLVFPIDCFMSVVALFEEGSMAEVATVGREGFIPTEVLAGKGVAQRTTFCQVAGRAAVVHRGVFLHAMETAPVFASLVYRNANARLYTSEQLMACNITHDLMQRCARWLLMTRDRLGRSEFYLTHEFLAVMLGVRRAGVTLAAGELQRLGAIRYHRGNVTIVDEDALVAAACECYPAIREVFEAALTGRPAQDLLQGHVRRAVSAVPAWEHRTPRVG